MHRARGEQERQDDQRQQRDTLDVSNGPHERREASPKGKGRAV
jgi:hypothetical protein